MLDRIPVIGRAVVRRMGRSKREFSDSASYWNHRYERGGTSGAGSYGRLADFKAEFLNAFVADRSVRSVVELGCGDGNQLALARYPAYVGLDVSATAVRICSERFAGDQTKRFRIHEPGRRIDVAELSLSLDVVYHLVEDDVFDRYMRDLFDASDRWVIIYSSNTDDAGGSPPHIRHRRFTDWVERERTDWCLVDHVPNRFPGDGNDGTSFADFYVFVRP